MSDELAVQVLTRLLKTDDLSTIKAADIDIG